MKTLDFLKRAVCLSRASLVMAVLAVVGAAGLPLTAAAQLAADDVDWKESELPPPPAFDTGKLVTFDAGGGSTLVFGIDPAAVRITPADSLVRYVLVATSVSGARNVMYEGIRCATAEVKTYARQAPDGRWTPLADPQWRSLYDSMPSKHALQLAKLGACQNRTPANSVNDLVSALKSGGLQGTGR